MAVKGTLVVAGYGPGISAAVTRRFGGEGYAVALLARTMAKLDAAAAELGAAGIKAIGYPADLTDAGAIQASLAKAQAELGPISAVLWNAYGEPKGVLDGSAEVFDANFRVGVSGLVAAVQAAYEDLKPSKGVVLVTGGGLGLEDEGFVRMANALHGASLAVAKAAQRKLVHLLHDKLSTDGIYVALVAVLSRVKGTPWGDGSSDSIAPEDIADQFWALAQARDPGVVFVTGLPS